MRVNMSVQTNKKLLKNKKVVEEINRHRWIESERAGHDIGFERASTQWLEEFSKAWMQYHMPKRKTPIFKSASSRRSAARKVSPKRSGRVKVKAKKT